IEKMLVLTGADARLMAHGAGEGSWIAAYPVPCITAIRSCHRTGWNRIVHPCNIVRDCRALTEGPAAQNRGAAEQQQSRCDTNTFPHSAPTVAVVLKGINRRTACNPVSITRSFSVGATRTSLGE